MTTELIFELISKAVAVLPTLVQAGMNIVDRVQNIKQLADAAKTGSVTPEMIKAVRDQLDADLNELDSDLPPESA